MAQLKNTLLITSILLLAACAAPFDNNEYSRMVEMRYTVDTAIEQKTCEQPTQMKLVSEKLQADARWWLIYSRYLPKNDLTVTMADALGAVTKEMAVRYQGPAPSTMYCNLKLKNIRDQLEIVLKTTAGRPR